MFDTITLISLQVFSYIVSLIIGFILGRMSQQQQQDKVINSKSGFFKQEAKKKKEVKLDERTFVTSTSIETLVKKNGEIGLSTVVEDNVSASVSKLAQLKNK